MNASIELDSQWAAVEPFIDALLATIAARDEDIAAFRCDGWDTAAEAAKAHIREQEEEIARLKQADQDLLRIARAVAKLDEYEGRYGGCVTCGGFGKHTDDCAWVLARKLVEST
jgi:hypothetical protein